VASLAKGDQRLRIGTCFRARLCDDNRAMITNHKTNDNNRTQESSGDLLRHVKSRGGYRNTRRAQETKEAGRSGRTEEVGVVGAETGMYMYLAAHAATDNAVSHDSTSSSLRYVPYRLPPTGDAGVNRGFKATPVHAFVASLALSVVTGKNNKRTPSVPTWRVGGESVAPPRRARACDVPLLTPPARHFLYHRRVRVRAESATLLTTLA